MEPIDTMNLAAMSLPPVKKEGTPIEKKESPADTTDLRLMLFPSQVHKLSCLLAVLAHMRDLVERLLVMESSKPLSSLDWRSQLHYRFNKENKAVSIKVRGFFRFPRKLLFTQTSNIAPDKRGFK